MVRPFAKHGYLHLSHLSAARIAILMNNLCRRLLCGRFTDCSYDLQQSNRKLHYGFWISVGVNRWHSRPTCWRAQPRLIGQLYHGGGSAEIFIRVLRQYAGGLVLLTYFQHLCPNNVRTYTNVTY